MAVMISAAMMSACGFKVDKQDSSAAGTNLSNYSASSGQVPGYNTLRTEIFESKCISCHGTSGGVSLDSYSSAVAAASEIRNAVLVTKAMPPNGSLSDSELQAIQSWLDNGTPESDVTGSTSAPTATPVAAPSVSPSSSSNVTYAQVSSQIFTPSCVSCHSGSRASAGVDLSSYTSVVSNLSAIQQEALTNQSMPPSQPLSSANQTLLKSWISEGAPQN
jgi:uncharacterized membrane protein